MARAPQRSEDLSEDVAAISRAVKALGVRVDGIAPTRSVYFRGSTDAHVISNPFDETKLPIISGDADPYELHDPDADTLIIPATAPQVWRASFTLDYDITTTTSASPGGQGVLVQGQLRAAPSGGPSDVTGSHAEHRYSDSDTPGGRTFRFSGRVIGTGLIDLQDLGEREIEFYALVEGAVANIASWTGTYIADVSLHSLPGT